MDMAKYKEMFIQECKEHLQSMNDALLQYEQNNSDLGYINNLFRDTHSIKGMAASMGYTQISELSHNLEDLLDQVRSNRITISTELVNVLFEGLDILECQINDLESGNEQLTSSPELIEKIHSFYEGASFNETIENKTMDVVPQMEENIPGQVLDNLDNDLDNGKEQTFKIQLSPNIQIPIARVLIVEKKLKKLGTIKSFSPELKDIKAGRFDGVLWIKVVSEKEPVFIVKRILEIPEIEAVELVTSTEKINIPSISRQQEQKKNGLPKTDSFQKPAIRDHPVRTKSSKIRVDIKLLDQLMNNVGEIIITKSRLRSISKSIANREFLLSMDQLDQLITEIHSNLMLTRMLPFDLIANRFPRVVRDVSMRAGKEIDFQVTGSEIELDRAILDELSDPLIHILRNAIDHGIELPEERINKGKPPRGKINLTVTREKESVLITVADDGAGIDPDAIRKSIIDKKLVPPEQAEILSNDELFMFICMPGFSTSDKITDISGRGVGMDVVKTSIESLGGTLDISSEFGMGTQFVLKLPLTIAIIDVLLTNVANSTFAVPISKIDRTMEVPRQKVINSHGQSLLEMPEGMVQLVQLHKALNIPNHTNNQPVLNIILVELKKKKVGLIVDELLGQEEMVIKPLGKPLERIKGFSGVTIMGDGRLVLILDVQNLFW